MQPWLQDLSFLTKLDWWKQSFRAALAFSPACLLTAAGVAGGDFLIWFGGRQACQLFSMNVITTDVLLRTAGVGLCCLLAGMLVITWALTVWVLKITAFSRACLKGATSPDASLFDTSSKEVFANKVFLLKLWSIASLYLLVVIVPLTLLASLRAVQYAEFLMSQKGAPAVTPATMLTDAGLTLCTVLLTGLTFTVVVLSSHTLSAAAKTAKAAVELFRHHSLSILVLALVVICINVAISAPQMLLPGASMLPTGGQDIISYVIWQIWFALSTSVLWPWSVSPFCRLLETDIGQ